MKRHVRKLNFVEHGKYIEQGNEMRTKSRIEELKEMIAENSFETGLDIELDLVAEQEIIVNVLLIKRIWNLLKLSGGILQNGFYELEDLSYYENDPKMS